MTVRVKHTNTILAGTLYPSQECEFVCEDYNDNACEGVLFFVENTEDDGETICFRVENNDERLVGIATEEFTEKIKRILHDCRLYAIYPSEEDPTSAGYKRMILAWVAPDNQTLERRREDAIKRSNAAKNAQRSEKFYAFEAVSPSIGGLVVHSFASENDRAIWNIEHPETSAIFDHGQEKFFIDHGFEVVDHEPQTLKER